MRIIQFTPSLVPTGPVAVALDLASIMRDMGHDVEFWYLDEKEGAVSEKGEKVSMFSLPVDEKVDIIHSHGMRPDLALAKLFGKSRSFRTVTTMHNLVEEDLKHQYSALISKIFSPLWVRWMRKHDARVSLTRRMKEYYLDKWSLGSEVIPNTRVVQPGKMDTTVAQRLNNLKKEGVLLGVISYLTSRKGLDQAIRLVHRYPEYRLVVFGEGAEAQNLKKMAADLTISDRILFEGHRPDAREYLPLMDILVMPSHSEGFPLSMLESIQYGTPVVSSRIPVFSESFNEDEIATFEIGNIQEFHHSISRVMADREGYITRAREHFERSYGPKAVGGAYEKLYQSLLK